MVSTTSYGRRWAYFTRVGGSAALAIAAAVALAGCPEKTDCAAQLVTGAGTYRGKASGPANEPAFARRKATKDACVSMCLQTKAVNMENCPAECVVDAEAGKVGVKITCTGDAAGRP